MLRRTLAHHAFAGCNPPLMRAIREKLGRPDGGLTLQEAIDVVEDMPEGDIFGRMFDEIMQAHYHREELLRMLGLILEVSDRNPPKEFRAAVREIALSAIEAARRPGLQAQTLTITTEGGCVVDVAGIPDGWLYEIIDLDDIE